MGITIRTPETVREWQDYYDLRYEVLRAPLGKPRGSERNDGDTEGLHFALYENEILRAIARLDKNSATSVQVRFVAVDPETREKGYGKMIMEATEDYARSVGYSEMVLHARDYAVGFYLKLGYSVIEPSHKLFGVLQHFLMKKQL